MIKNERQFKLTRAQVERFAATLDDLANRDTSDIHPVQQQLEIDSVAGMIAELEQSMGQYEGLRAGTIQPAPVRGVDSLARALIEHRIAEGLSQRQLAERLGLKEQQIQRYEAEDWATANLARLTQVALALGLTLAPTSASDPGLDSARIVRALEDVGVDREFVARRIAPSSDSGLATVVDLTARLSRVYGWAPADIINGTIEQPEPLLAAASFKVPKAHKAPRTNAYTVYSHYLALQVLAATPHLVQGSIPTEASVVRSMLYEPDHTVTFERVLDFVWSLGIPVVPLSDPGAFHAVLWRHQSRNVIVLKQQNRASSRWLFDLLHELRHAGQDPENVTHAVVDGEISGEVDDSEYEANEFAGAVLLDNRADEIAEEAVRSAKGSVERLSSVVPRVAARNDVGIGDLANFLAYRLSLQDIDWWGAATNLQPIDSDPCQTATERFIQEIDLRLLNPVDRDLVTRAVSGSE